MLERNKAKACSFLLSTVRVWIWTLSHESADTSYYCKGFLFDQLSHHSILRCLFYLWYILFYSSMLLQLVSRKCFVSLSKFKFMIFVLITADRIVNKSYMQVNQKLSCKLSFVKPQKYLETLGNPSGFVSEKEICSESVLTINHRATSPLSRESPRSPTAFFSSLPIFFRNDMVSFSFHTIKF